MNAKSKAKWGSLVVCALALPGCYTTTVSSGKPAARATVAYDERWHSGVINGIAELSGPHNLDEICPQGWSEIKTETSFLNGFVELATSGIYNPQEVTVRCALPSEPALAQNTAPKGAPTPSELGPPPPAPSQGPPATP